MYDAFGLNTLAIDFRFFLTSSNPNSSYKESTFFLVTLAKSFLFAFT